MFCCICTHRGCYLGIYGGLGLSQASFVLFAAFSLAIAGIFASTTVHNRMLNNILRSPMSFFDTTPLGRIMNRFSEDIYTIDEIIPGSLRSFTFAIFSVISTIVVIMIATPTFGIVIVPLAILYIFVQVSYIRSITLSKSYTIYFMLLSSSVSMWQHCVSWSVWSPSVAPPSTLTSKSQ